MSPVRLHELQGATLNELRDAVGAARIGWRADIAARTQDMLSADTRQARDAAYRPLRLAITEEAKLTGFELGLNRGYALAKVERKHISTEAAKMLDQAAAENARLRLELYYATQELIPLRAALRGVERIARLKIIAASTYTAPKPKRLAPRSAVIPRHLSHDKHVERIARRIEEFLYERGGRARKQQLEAHMLPETPRAAFEAALTHLLLSRRVARSPNGHWGLREGRRNAPQTG